MAEAALDDGVADLVEMTRAQIADPRLVAMVRAGAGPTGAAVHPLQPGLPGPATTGIRWSAAWASPGRGTRRWTPTPRRAPPATPAGSSTPWWWGPGPAGLECARVLALQGHRVRVVERSDRTGGALRAAAVGPGRERLADLADVAGGRVRPARA